MALTNERINTLISRREAATNRRDEQIDWALVNLIDTQLAEVPPGQRNDVDLLLGRLCAVMTERKDYGIAQAEQDRLISEMADQAADFDTYMRALCADYDIEAPDYPGMWK